ncbi:MAG: DUF504 domain-containing protein [Nanoarchaeota archaeon]
MLTEKEFLNKIKWDPRENIKDYALMYYDRVEKKLEELKITQVNIQDNFFVFDNFEGETINIPLHRIRMIKKKEEIVWKRSTKK